MSQATTHYLTEWHASDGLPGIEPERVASVTDGANNLYVAGAALNDYGKYDLHIAKYTDKGGKAWSETFNLTDTTANVIVGQIILDNSGNLIVTGTVYNGPTNRYDALTVKFNASGVYQWHELYNGSGSHDDGGYDLYCDSIGNIYIAGGATDDTDLMDFLVIAYESDGDLLWVQTIDGYGYFDAASRIRRRHNQVVVYGVLQAEIDKWKIGVQYIYMATGVLDGDIGITYENIGVDEIADLTTDSAGNFYVTGYKNNGSSGRDIITQKYDNELYQLWSQTWNGTSSLADQPYAIAVDESDGSVYVAGVSNKTGEGKNFIVLRYNASGTLQWAYSRNGDADGDDEAIDIGLDTLGNIIAAGYITGESNKDYFVEILNSSGVSQWTGRFNGIHNLDDRGQKLTVTPSGQISLTGKTATPTGDTYTTVRYTPKSILIPPDEEEASTALYFTENRGQLLDTNEEEVSEIKFYSDRQSPALFFQEEGFSFVTAIIDGDTATNDTLHRVDVRFRQSKGEERIYGLEARADFHNYYLGHIPEGREKVGLYDRLIHTDIFPGIDLHYYSNSAGRKYYFVVNPGANPDDIGLAFSGHSSLSVNGSGDLVIGTAAGNIVLPEPEAFLVTSMGEVSSVGWTPEFQVVADTVTIGTGSYGDEKWLVIRVKEEVAETLGSLGNLEWCTYYGGSLFDNVRNSTVDNNGNYYVVGGTSSINFPQLNGLHSFMGGASDAFLVAFDINLTRLFATLIGGTGEDIAHGVAFGENGIHVVGETEGAGANSGPLNINNFPLSNDGVIVYDGSNRCNGFSSCVDAFIAKFSINGIRQFATFFGNDGSSQLGRETAFAIEVHESGFYVAGGLGGNVPVVNTNMSSLYENSVGDAFIASFNNNFSQLIWCSRFKAGVIFNIDTDDEGNVFIGGNVRLDHNLPLVAETSSSYQSAFNGGMLDRDGFMAKISPAPHELLWSTHYGGSNPDDLFDIKIDNDGNLLIAGQTASSDLDIFEPSLDDTFDGISSDGFIGKFNNSGEPLWTSYLGGSSGTTAAFSVTVDGNNNIYIGLFTGAEELAVLNPGDLYEQELTEDSNNPNDAYLLALTENATPLWSTFLGYLGNDEIVSLETTPNKLYFAGNCNISPTLSPSTNEFPLVQFSTNPNSFFSPSVNKIGANPAGFMGRFDIGVLTDTRTQTNNHFLFDVYPNPSNNVLFLNFYNKQDALGKIYTANGQLVEQFKIGSGFQNIEIPVNYLPPGVYFIILISDGAVITRKVIID